MKRLFAVIVVAGCGHPAAEKVEAPKVVAPVAQAPVAACAAPEYRQLDFWHGDWDVTVKARQTPDGPWGEAPGTQHVESILGGCATAEHFAADGPGAPWAGASYSSWQPQLGKWRQTWVDDSGGYLAFVGGLEDGVMTLYGEPRVQGDKTIQMRMRFEDVTATSLHWSWERSEDGAATWTPMMTADYRRR
jgi:hypothetical protein